MSASSMTHNRPASNQPRESMGFRAQSSGAEISKADTGNAGGNVQKIVLIGLAVGAAAVFASQLPELRRYLRMRAM